MRFLQEKKRIIAAMTLGLMFMSCSAFSQQIRGIAEDAISIEDDSLTPDLPSQKVIKGEVTELEAVVGKSRMIRFDEPAKRISIADPALADIVVLSPSEILINGKSAGATSLIVWGTERDPAFFDLVVKNDSKAFLKAVKKVIPDRNLKFEFTDKNVILTGLVSSTIKKDKIANIAKAYGFELVDLAESPTPQVQIEVKVAEVSRSYTKELSSVFSKGPKAGAYATGATASAGSSFYMVDFNGAGPVDYLLHSPNNQFATELKAGITKGYVRILAEPKLIATDGSEASFNAGQEVPVPSSIGMGGNVSYDFKKVGIIMTFKPKIQEQLNRVSMDITPEVSEIDPQATNGGAMYGFKTRKVNTHVELMDGQTLIIAGLIKHTGNDTNTIVPGFGDLPVIGNFFKAYTLKKDETELMIFVTPKIIAPEGIVDRI